MPSSLNASSLVFYEALGRNTQNKLTPGQRTWTGKGNTGRGDGGKKSDRAEVLVPGVLRTSDPWRPPL